MWSWRRSRVKTATGVTARSCLNLPHPVDISGQECEDGVTDGGKGQAGQGRVNREDQPCSCVQRMLEQQN